MPNPISRIVQLERISTNKLNELAVNDQLTYIKKRAQGNTTYKIKASLKNDGFKDFGEKGYQYLAKLKITKVNYRATDVANRQLDNVTQQIESAAKTKGWRIIDKPTDVQNPELADQIIKEDTPIVINELSPQNMQIYFSGIYERESHINLIYSSAQTAIQTNFNKRSHVLLHGLPATAKSSIFLAFKAFFEAGRSNEVVAMIDATTLTKAGLERWILNKAQAKELPKFLVLEELEKHQPDNLLCLLSVMDNRASLSRTNAIVGQVVAEAKMVIWGTCNNDDLLKNFHKGALWSRFQHRFVCRRPSKTLMKKILEREVIDMDGKLEWIEPAMDIGYNLLPNLTGEACDPRQMIALLDGQDGLLDGSYRKYLAKAYGGE